MSFRIPEREPNDTILPFKVRQLYWTQAQVKSSWPTFRGSCTALLRSRAVRGKYTRDLCYVILTSTLNCSR